MSTYISLTLPSYFSDIEIMKRNSYPFSHAFTRLLKALKTVQDETDMPFYLLVGQIEAESGQDFTGPDDDRVSFRFTYTEKDPEACQFLKDNAQENGESVKNIVLRILQMCLRLRMGGYPSFDAIANLTLFGAQDSQRPVRRDIQRYEPTTRIARSAVKRSVTRSSQRTKQTSKASQEVKKEADYGDANKGSKASFLDAKGKSSGDAEEKSNSVKSSNPSSVAPSKPASNSVVDQDKQDKQETSNAPKHPGITIKKGKEKKENKPEISDSTRELLNKSKAKREELEQRAKEQENMKEKLEGAVVETNSLLSSFLR